MSNSIPQFGAKDLGEYCDLGRGPVTSYYRRVAVMAGHPPDAGILARLKAFTSGRANWMAWFTHVLGYATSPRHEFQTYKPGGGIYRFTDKLNLSMAGDWGTGTDEALQVLTQMASHNPDYTIHLGDVYYVGDSPELEMNCLGVSTAHQTGVTWQHERSAAEQRLWERFTQWSAQWHGRESELQYVNGTENRNLYQGGLGTSLQQAIFSGEAWLTDKPKLQRLRQLSAGPSMQQQVDEVIVQWDQKPWRIDFVPSTDSQFNLLQYKSQITRPA